MQQQPRWNRKRIRHASLLATNSNKASPMKRKAKAPGTAIGKGTGRLRAKRMKTMAPRLRTRKQRPIPTSGKSSAFWTGFSAGKEDASLHSIEHEPFQKKALNLHWMNRVRSMNLAREPWIHYAEAAKGYVHGFLKAKGQHPHDWLLVPTSRSIAAIITVMNEEQTIGSILHQLNRLPLDEIYVIVNGSSDRSFEIARTVSHAVIVSYPHAVGHDVGRAIGANMAKSDILLFLDGDIPVQAEQLIPFLSGVEHGLDIALNDMTPFLTTFGRSDSVTYVKQFLNLALNRSDLGSNSLTAVPHALSRRTLDTIGVHSLMVPPKAQVLASISGLKIGVGGSVNVIQRNKLRDHNVGSNNRTADLIIGDHVEAIKLANERVGDRLYFIDNQRKREFARGP